MPDSWTGKVLVAYNPETRKLETVPDIPNTLLAGETLVTRIAANIAAESTVDGSDAGTTQALANALKVKVNALLAALKAAGLMTVDT